MGNESLLKNPKTALLASGSVLFASAFIDICSGGTAFTLPLIATAGFGILKDVAPEFFGASFQETFLKNVSRKEILQNGDLRRAVGKTIFVLILDESNNEEYKSFCEIIRSVGKSSLKVWENYINGKFNQENAQNDSTTKELEKILPNQLVPYFARRENELDSVTALNPEIWAEIVRELFQHETYYPSQEVCLKIGQRLFRDFPRVLRKVLIDDFSSDGKAYASMQLRISSEMLSFVVEIKKGNDEIKEEIKQLKQNFNQISQRFLSEVKPADDTFWNEIVEAQKNLLSVQKESLGVQKSQLSAQTESLEQDKQQTEYLRQIAESTGLTQKQQEEAFKGVHKSFPRVQNFFTGRERVLEDLERTLKNEKQASFYGTHGLGKTRTAIEYALRNKDKYNYILFISATKGNFISNAAFVGAEISEEIEKAPTLETKFELFINHLQKNPNWLIICDNVEDVEEVIGKIPRHFDGNVIYTSNLRQIYKAAKLIIIEAMSQSEAELTILCRSLNNNKAQLKQIYEQERKFISKLVEKIGTLPIGLNLAGAYIYDNQLTFQEYLENYEIFEEETLGEFDIDDYYGSEFTKGLTDEEKTKYKGIAGVFLLSYSRMVKQKSLSDEEKLICETTEKVLKLCSFLAPDRIPEIIWKTGIIMLDNNLKTVIRNARLWLKVTNRLTQAAFFIRNPEFKAFTTHRLILRILFKQLDETERFKLLEVVTELMNKLFPDAEHKNWDTIKQLFSHAESVLTYTKQFDIVNINVNRLYHEIACYLDGIAQFDRAYFYYQIAISTSLSIYGENSEKTASIYNNLATSLNAKGKYDDALVYYKKALLIDMKILGKESLNFASDLNNIGAVFHAKKEYKKSLYYCKKALEIREKLLGSEDLLVLQSKNNLAELYKNLDNLDEAYKICIHTLNIRKQKLGENDIITARSMNTLAGIQLKRGYYKEAEDLYFKVLKIRLRFLGEDHPDTANIYNNLGRTYYHYGKYSLSLAYYYKSLKIRINILTEKHLDTAEIYKNVAELFYINSEPIKAFLFFEKSYRIFKNILGDQHEATVDLEQSLDNCRMRFNHRNN